MKSISRPGRTSEIVPQDRFGTIRSRSKGCSRTWGSLPESASALRRGTSLIELVIAGILISTAIVLAATTITGLSTTRRRTEQMQCAILELNNQMERISTLAWGDLTAERLSNIQMDEQTSRRLPGARLSVAFKQVTSPHPAKQVSAQIHWPDTDYGVRPPVRLTTWFFAVKESP